MTYKYYDVRRDIYNECSDKSLKKFRTFKEMRKLFKLKFWIIFVLMMICLILMCVLSLCLPNKGWYFIPMIILIILSIISEIQGETLYNSAERKEEIDKQGKCYDEYVKNIITVLNSNGLYTKEQWSQLKEECKLKLESHESSYKSIGNQIYNILIGVPLGALISSLIYKNSDAVVKSIIGIIILGIVCILIIKILKKITFYTDGYFKDEYLMSALCELDYYSKSHDN